MIVDALAALGVDAQRVEYSFNGAFMWAEFDGGSALFVSAVPIGTDGGDFSVLNERLIRGVTVQQVRYPTGPVRDRFDCANATYEAEGATPPGFAQFDDFLLRFIEGLHCSQ